MTSRAKSWPLGAKGKRAARPPSSELAIHCAIVQLLDLTKRPDVMFWHTPNGEKRDKATAAKLKRMGVRPGVSDILIMDGRGFYAMEVKAPGEKPTQDQRDFLDLFAKRGHIAVVESVDQAQEMFMLWNLTRIATR